MYTRIYLLKFPKDITDQPIICNLVKQFDIDFNILKADILLQQEGILVLQAQKPQREHPQGHRLP